MNVLLCAWCCFSIVHCIILAAAEMKPAAAQRPRPANMGARRERPHPPKTMPTTIHLRGRDPLRAPGRCVAGHGIISQFDFLRSTRFDRSTPGPL